MEAEDLNTWAKQELSSHGQNVSFKNWAKKEVKSHGNIDLVDWAKHEKQSHTKKYGAESFSLDSKKADSINMAELMDCDFCGGTDEVGYVDDDLTLKVCEHCDVDGTNAQIHYAEEPVIEEPSFIPDGDGRAIGQQNSSINLSPLHAESRFDKLSKEIADEYEEKGMSPEKAQEVGDATAAMIGRKKYGKKGMAQMQRKGMQSESDRLHSWATNMRVGVRDLVEDLKRGAVYDLDDCRERLEKIRDDMSHLDAEGNLVDINYDAKIRLNNPKDARYITPSIEEGMAFEEGEGVLSSNAKIDMNAEGDAATYSPSSNPDMVNEIQTSPTNESPQLFNAGNTFNTTTALGIGGLVVAALSLPMIYSAAKSRLGKSAEEKRKASGSVRKNHTQIKNSEYSVGQVNPVEAEGQQDIHGAEGITNPRHIPSPTPSGYPSKSLKMW